MSEVELGKAAPETTESETTAGASEETDATESSAPKRRFALPALGARATVGLRTAAAAIVGASVASSVYFFLQNERSTELIDAREAARSAACNYAPLLATYDAKNLDAYFTAVLDGATGDWRTQFDSTSKDLREVLTQGQVVSKATDVQCGIRTSDESSAEAIVVIGQTITSLGTQNKPSPGQLSMVMRLEKQGDRWLVNKVNSPMAQQATP
ncbi:hypothetical protein [Nocardia huaxiensis]|uniref:hypothetical protein n=1 Tax=Nocardia huaxiensis TaxID=2755382 RepID=UPI001E368948|nr:hypothetical protein [Nocardia huaxiensis]UFS93893.1 hypothetical protein LPY97_24275 [Nocardia huaxiensis]